MHQCPSDLQIAAVIAHDGGLDDARAFDVGTGRGRRTSRGRCAVVRPARRARSGASGRAPRGRGRRAHSGDRAIASRTSARSSCSVIPSTSTLSMMPMTAASTGAPLRPSASPAARPSMHDQHFLVHAGADGIDRQQRRAARRVVERDRLHQQQLGAFELRGASASRRRFR